MRGGLVPARTFEDSAGTVWEVFEVHRSSHNAQAVSAGLELGWLAFVSGSLKRRLAPFPKEWQSADTAELERLCQQARAANASRIAPPPPVGGVADATPAEPRARMPRLRRWKERSDAQPPAELPIGATASSDDPVEQTVRRFAQEARTHRLQAIEAMVQLKALLARVYTSPTSDARNLRAVRRWFVEAYYFERDERLRPETPDQSR
jgi:hypothetical protein